MADRLDDCPIHLTVTSLGYPKAVSKNFSSPRKASADLTYALWFPRLKFHSQPYLYLSF